MRVPHDIQGLVDECIFVGDLVVEVDQHHTLGYNQREHYVHPFLKRQKLHRHEFTHHLFGSRAATRVPGHLLAPGHEDVTNCQHGQTCSIPHLVSGIQVFPVLQETCPEVVVEDTFLFLVEVVVEVVHNGIDRWASVLLFYEAVEPVLLWLSRETLQFLQVAIHIFLL